MHSACPQSRELIGGDRCGPMQMPEGKIFYPPCIAVEELLAYWVHPGKQSTFATRAALGDLRLFEAGGRCVGGCRQEL